ncbi:transcriptional regulator [Enterobacterales bacterium CwR94]|nr:transcriptional regulator [Enterobacterales bacterium CwR94]
MTFNFDTPVDRRGSWCTQWDFVADRFGQPDLLPFTISDMDFPTAPVVIEELHRRVAHGVLGYSRWQHDDFINAIAHWYQQRFATSVDKHQVVYGPSVIYMVAQLIRLWSAPGEGVVIHTPAYDAFTKTITGNQRQVMALPLQKHGNDWLCDMQALEQLLAQPHCKVLLLCSPHNPTGKVWTLSELQQMAALCERHQVRVISDEIHMDMVFGDRVHIPWIQVARGHWALFTSASKSFNIPALTGAYGFIAEESDRQAWFQALKNADGLSSPAILSVAAHITAYQQGAPWLDALRAYLQDNLHCVADTLNAAFPQLQWQPPAATYLAWLDLSPLNIDAVRLQTQLIEHEKVAIMPGGTYGPQSQQFLRLNCGCPRVKLEDGLQRLINGIRCA